MLECVINISEGRDTEILDVLSASCGGLLLDRHTDPDHHRSVFTIGGPAVAVEQAARRLAVAAVAHLDLRLHTGAHPRLGVVDVVPFVSLVPEPGHGPPDGRLVPGPLLLARCACDAFCQWAADTLDLPCFTYGPDSPDRHSLPEVRRHAFGSLAPTTGPDRPHPSAGACAVGARGPLVAYNLWLDGGDRELAADVASALRRPGVRALGLELSGRIQISMNLTDPVRIGPADAYDSAAALLADYGVAVDEAELVGLVPRLVLEATDPSRWAELGLDPDQTIESRLVAEGISWR